MKGGSAWRDGKLREGDRIVSINGIDVDGLDLEAVRRRLTGLDRFVRVVVERLEPVDPNCECPFGLRYRDHILGYMS